MDEKVTIGSRIGEKHKEIVSDLTDMLNTKKYRVYEAAVDIFNALPRILQLALISDDTELREEILGIIKKLSVPPQPKKGGKKR